MTKEERELLRCLLENSGEKGRAMIPQLEKARAKSACSCGCPSIDIDVQGKTPANEHSKREIVADFVGQAPQVDVGLILWAYDGTLDGLEVYSLDNVPGDGKFSLPPICSLKPFGSA